MGPGAGERAAPFPAPSLASRVLHSSGLRWLGVVVLGAVALLEGIEALGGPEGIRERFGARAGLLLVPVQMVVSASPVPGELVALIQVSIYGIWPGALLCWCGWVGASFIEYAIARRTTTEVLDGGRERLPAALRRLPADHPAFLILTRFLPFGGHVAAVTAGVCGVAAWRFAWTTLLAFVPVAFGFSAIATGLLGR